MKKVFISTTSFGEDNPSVLKALNHAKIKVVLNPYSRRLTEDEIINVLVKGGYEGLLAGLEPLTQKVFAKANRLKVISRVGVGLDNVDQEAARLSGIKVFNTPGVLTDAVAELTLGLILSVLRRLSLSDRRMHQGQWEKHMGALLKGKTLGIIGMGDIGKQVATLGLAFKATVIFADVRAVKNTGAKQVSLQQLFKDADIISLHCSGKTPLIGGKEITLLKKGAIIINTARGSLIDEKALIKGLSSGKIAGAGLDVFEQEPYQGLLSSMDQVVLTPHIGSYAKEARIMMEKMAVDNLLKGLKGT